MSSRRTEALGSRMASEHLALTEAERSLEGQQEQVLDGAHLDPGELA